MILSKFAKNTVIGFILPNIYTLFFDTYIKNKILKQQLKKRAFSIQSAFFLGSMSVLYLQKKINQKQFYDAFGISNGSILLYYTTQLKKKDYPMIFHHLMMQLTILSTQILDNNFIPNLDLIMARIYLCEFTSIFLYPYMMLYKLNYKNKIIMNLLKICIAISFFLLRVCNFTNIQYYLYKHNISLCFYLMLPFTSLNYAWFYKIIKLSGKQ